MVVGRTDEQQNPSASMANTCRSIVWMLLAEPIWARGHDAAQKGRTHDRIRTHVKFCKNYLNPTGRPHTMLRRLCKIIVSDASAPPRGAGLFAEH